MKISDQSLYTIPSLYKPANPSFVSFKCKKRVSFMLTLFFLVDFAEREGFEPPEPRSSTVFKTAAIDHSATSPNADAKIGEKLILQKKDSIFLKKR